MILMKKIVATTSQPKRLWGYTPVPTSEGVQLATEGAEAGQGEESGSAPSRQAQHGGGKEALSNSPTPVISAGLTVAPVARTSLASGSRHWGAVLHGYHPQPRMPSPHGSTPGTPHSPSASPPRNFQRPFPGRLLSSVEQSPRSDPLCLPLTSRRTSVCIHSSRRP